MVGLFGFKTFTDIQKNFDENLNIEVGQPTEIRKFKRQAEEFTRKYQVCQEENIDLRNQVYEVKSYSNLSPSEKSNLLEKNKLYFMAEKMLLEEAFSENFWDKLKDKDYEVHKSIVTKMKNLSEAYLKSKTYKEEIKSYTSTIKNLENEIDRSRKEFDEEFDRLNNELINCQKK